MKRSIFLISFFSMKSSARKSRTSPAMRVGKSVASNRLIVLIPERPWREGFPVLFDACAERSDQAETSDGDAPVHIAVIHGVDWRAMVRARFARVNHGTFRRFCDSSPLREAPCESSTVESR